MLVLRLLLMVLTIICLMDGHADVSSSTTGMRNGGESPAVKQNEPEVQPLDRKKKKKPKKSKKPAKKKKPKPNKAKPKPKPTKPVKTTPTMSTSTLKTTTILTTPTTTTTATTTTTTVSPTTTATSAKITTSTASATTTLSTTTSATTTVATSSTASTTTTTIPTTATTSSLPTTAETTADSGAGGECEATNGKPCIFPFKDGKEEYNECKNEGGKYFWCATAVYDSGKYKYWSYCSKDGPCPLEGDGECRAANNKPCVFPFKDGNKEYNECADHGGKYFWCATGTNSAGKYTAWSKCPKDGSCPLSGKGTTTVMPSTETTALTTPPANDTSAAASAIANVENTLNEINDTLQNLETAGFSEDEKLLLETMNDLSDYLETGSLTRSWNYDPFKINYWSQQLYSTTANIKASKEVNPGFISAYQTTETKCSKATQKAKLSQVNAGPGRMFELPTISEILGIITNAPSSSVCCAECKALAADSELFEHSTDQKQCDCYKTKWGVLPQTMASANLDSGVCTDKGKCCFCQSSQIQSRKPDDRGTIHYAEFYGVAIITILQLLQDTHHHEFKPSKKIGSTPVGIFPHLNFYLVDRKKNYDQHQAWKGWTTQDGKQYYKPIPKSQNGIYMFFTAPPKALQDEICGDSVTNILTELMNLKIHWRETTITDDNANDCIIPFYIGKHNDIKDRYKQHVDETKKDQGKLMTRWKCMITELDPLDIDGEYELYYMFLELRNDFDTLLMERFFLDQFNFMDNVDDNYERRSNVLSEEKFFFPTDHAYSPYDNNLKEVNLRIRNYVNEQWLFNINRLFPFIYNRIPSNPWPKSKKPTDDNFVATDKDYEHYARFMAAAASKKLNLNGTQMRMPDDKNELHFAEFYGVVIIRILQLLQNTHEFEPSKTVDQTPIGVFPELNWYFVPIPDELPKEKDPHNRHESHPAWVGWNKYTAIPTATHGAYMFFMAPVGTEQNEKCGEGIDQILTYIMKYTNNWSETTRISDNANNCIIPFYFGKSTDIRSRYTDHINARKDKSDIMIHYKEMISKLKEKYELFYIFLPLRNDFDTVFMERLFLDQFNFMENVLDNHSRRTITGPKYLSPTTNNPFFSANVLKEMKLRIRNYVNKQWLYNINRLFPFVYDTIPSNPWPKGKLPTNTNFDIIETQYDHNSRFKKNN